TPWGRALNRGSDAVTVLDLMAKDTTLLGAPIRRMAKQVADAYRAAKIPPPSIQLAMGTRLGSTMGIYTPSVHAIHIYGPRTRDGVRISASPKTIVHEALHGLTYLALTRTRSSDPAITALEKLRSKLSDSVRMPGFYAVKDIGETIAEMANPPVLALMDSIPIKESDFTAQEWALIKGEGQPKTLLDLFANFIRSVVKAVAPGFSVSGTSLADGLRGLSAHLASSNAGEVLHGAIDVYKPMSKVEARVLSADPIDPTTVNSEVQIGRA